MDSKDLQEIKNKHEASENLKDEIQSLEELQMQLGYLGRSKHYHQKDPNYKMRQKKHRRYKAKLARKSRQRNR